MAGISLGSAVHMRLDPLPERLPPCPLPAGYRLRRYGDGDADAWVRIHRLAERLQRVTPATFERSFGLTSELLPERQYYLCREAGEAIGTATAWFHPSFQGQPHGRLHWIAVTPEHQGRGLGRYLVAVVLHRLRQLGHARAYLATHTGRIPAISLYLTLGFVPCLDSVDARQAWRELAARAPGLTTLATYLHASPTP